ncbi:hypothetical protein [Hyella patelloides]|uniref:hypothetical protein n=1 Tax=Hyella patelloides TaxID=1982969 RepID=UPI0011A6C21C|nr:hypothetical protein [Hyella patelloides]
MNHILPQAEELLLTLKQILPSIYQQETLESNSVYFSLEKVMLFLIIVRQNQKVLSADFSIIIIGQLVP